MWSTGPQVPVFRDASEIHIWRLLLPLSPSRQDRLCKNLSQAEFSRAMRFHFDHDRIQFKMGRAVLREILSRYVHIPPNEIHFDYAEYGKPYLNNANIYFNVSHSNHYLLIAIARQGSVGVDVEYCKPNIQLLEVAKEFCSIEEYQSLLPLPDSERQLRFYQYWTHKEALVKGLGRGISFPLRQVEVYLKSLRKNFSYKIDLRHPSLSEKQTWRIHHIPLGSEYTAALASGIDPSTDEQNKAYQALCFWNVGEVE